MGVVESIAHSFLIKRLSFSALMNRLWPLHVQNSKFSENARKKNECPHGRLVNFIEVWEVSEAG